MASTKSQPKRPPLASPSGPPSSSRAEAQSGSSTSGSNSSSSSSTSPPPPPPPWPRNRVRKILPWIPVAAFFYNTTYSIGTVNGGSMVPTLNPEFSTLGISSPRDWVILDRLTTARGSWKVGDVVVLVSPTDPNIHYTKRILALPGDIVRLPHKRRIERSPGSFIQVEGYKRIKVPPGHCWVEGDSSVYAVRKGEQSSTSPSSDPARSSKGVHVDRSTDSRHFGPIPLALLTAKVSYIFYPFSRAGTIPDRPGFLPVSEHVDSTAFDGSAFDWTWLPFGADEKGKGDEATSLGGWKRVEDDSRLTPYADAQSVDVGGGRRRTRVIESEPRDELRPREVL